MFRNFRPQCPSTSYFFGLFNYFGFYVTDESFVDEAPGVNTKFNPGIYVEFIYNHLVDVTAVGVLIPREYHQHVITSPVVYLMAFNDLI